MANGVTSWLQLDEAGAVSGITSWLQLEEPPGGSSLVGLTSWLQIDEPPVEVAADAPSNVEGLPDSSQTSTITWDAPVSGGVPTGYDVQYEAPTGSGNWITAAGASNPTAAGVLTFSATGQTPGMQVTPRVRSKKAGFADSAWAYGAPYYLDVAVGGEAPITVTLTDKLEDALGTLHSEDTVYYSFYPGGRLGSLTGIAPVEGSVLSAIDGSASIVGLPVGPGALFTCVRGANAGLDSVHYHPVVVS